MMDSGQYDNEGDSNQPPEWAPFFESVEQYDRFERAVRFYFRDRGQSVMIDDGFVRGMHPGEGETGLSNIGQICAQNDEELWPELIALHFNKLTETRTEGDSLEEDVLDFEAVRAHLAIRLFTEEQLGQVLDEAVVREDIPGLLSVLCIDLPSGMRSVNRNRISHWNTSDDELLDIAQDNTRALIDAEPAFVEAEDSSGLWIAEGESIYNSSALLHLGSYPQFSGTHGMFISAPTRHCILALPIDSMEAMHAVGFLMSMTAHAEQRGPGSLSTRVWWHKDGRWIDIPWRMTDEGVAVNAPEEFVEVLNQLASDEDERAGQ